MGDGYDFALISKGMSGIRHKVMKIKPRCDDCVPGLIFGNYGKRKNCCSFMCCSILSFHWFCDSAMECMSCCSIPASVRNVFMTVEDEPWTTVVASV